MFVFVLYHRAKKMSIEKKKRRLKKSAFHLRKKSGIGVYKDVRRTDCGFFGRFLTSDEKHCKISVKELRFGEKE